MNLSILLITFGLLLIAGLGLDALGRLTRLPRITLLVLFGLAIGPSGVDLLPISVTEWYDIVAKLALTMIAFLLGGELSRNTLTAHGRAILAVPLSVTVVTVATIGLGLFAMGVGASLALLLAGIGLATDPAATRDVVQETGKTGRFAKTVLGVVAIDDAWGVIAFRIILGLVAGVGSGNGVADGLAEGLTEVFGAVLVGLAIGVPAAFATGRIAPGEPTLVEALGVVLLCAGLSLHLEVSFLLAGMTAGMVVVNFARHHDYPFHEIEHISWPFLVLFFVLAGAAVDFDALAGAGTLAAAFIVLRMAGRLLGGWLGGTVGGLPRREASLVGLALTPQAGVALGMALVASEATPAIGDTILVTTVATTIFFELFGPLLTRAVLLQVYGRKHLS